MKKSNENSSTYFKLSTIKSLHKWLSLLVFIQLFIWLGTGIFFNWMDHAKASGNQYRQAFVKQDIDPQRLLAPHRVLVASNSPASEITLVQRLGQPYYLLTHDKGLYSHFDSHFSLVDAYTGTVKQIDIEMASALAQSSYSGSGKIAEVLLVRPPIADFLKEKNNLWQVNFIDELDTSVYINASSGRLVGHSNEDKRFVDFFFMLHFMDYAIFGQDAVGGFNNWQIIFFAILTLLFCLTGLIWTVELLIQGRYKVR
ncbi:PepSY domain-containing protein [Colwellia piezophila]|uniref:PepSY domain-containing protein n=1 Tax=Colwellia piezophila TaxID=211668 RepID=UPI000367B223|nr:PepSY domain-containing protein [Colwellia piezophila]